MILPDFYGRFRCKAGACQHTCCRGWDIDIDDVTADYYQQLEGPLGEAIRQHIAEGPDGWHFCLTAEGNCPFLRPDGLCQLIRQAGDDILCDICASIRVFSRSSKTAAARHRARWRRPLL